MIHPTVREDLKTELSRRGRSIDEFDVSDQERLADESLPISAYVSTVTIKHRKSGIGRTYETALSPPVVVPFLRDVDAGVFG